MRGAVDPEVPADAGPDGDGDGRRRPRAPGWGLVATLLAPVVVFADALILRRMLAPGDGFHVFIPLHLLVTRILRAGEVPGWNPFAFSGSPLLALNQAGVFYPPNLVYLVLSPALANNVSVVLSFVVAASGVYALTRLLTGDEVGAAVAGLAFGLSGFMFGHIGQQNMIASIAWLPWAFFGYELLRQRFSPLRLLGAATALALVLLAGHPQMFFVALLALGVHAATMTALELRSRRGRPAGMLVVLVGTALALAAVQLVPTAAILDATDRAAVSFQTATSYSLPKTHLALLTFPYLFGNNVPLGPFTEPYRGAWNLTELASYPGAAALCLAAAGLGAARRDRRLLGLLAAAGVALLIALGASTPVGRLVYELPVYGQFRNWARYVVVFDLVVAVLAGAGVAALRQGSARQRRRVAAGAGIAASVVVLGALTLPHVGAIQGFMVDGPSRVLALAVPTGFAVAAAGVCALAIRSRRWAPGVACVVVAADAVFSFGLFYEWRAGLPSVEQVRTDYHPGRPPQWGEIPDAPGGVDRYIVGSPDVADVPTYVNVTVVKGLRSANGYEPLAPRGYTEAVGGMTFTGAVTRPEDLWRPGSDLLDLLRVSVLLTSDGTTPVPGEGAVVGDGRAAADGAVTRYEHRPRLPEAFVVGAVQRASRQSVLDAVQGRDDFDPSRVALVERGCRPCAAMDRPGRAGTASLTRPDTQGIEVDVRAERPGLLVVSEAWFPGWSATVDGEPAPVLRADGLVLGVPVEAGASDVVLRYRAPGLRLGALVSAGTAIVLAAAHLLARRRRRAPYAGGAQDRAVSPRRAS